MGAGKFSEPLRFFPELFAGSGLRHQPHQRTADVRDGAKRCQNLIDILGLIDDKFEDPRGSL